VATGCRTDSNTKVSLKAVSSSDVIVTLSVPQVTCYVSCGCPPGYELGYQPTKAQLLIESGVMASFSASPF
jgi:hypothetical protein